MPTTLIRGGRVIDPAAGLDRAADVAIADGRIARIDQNLSPSGADETVDASVDRCDCSERRR